MINVDFIRRQKILFPNVNPSSKRIPRIDLYLKNTTEQVEYKIGNIVNDWRYTYYYGLIVNFPEGITPGEYEYRLVGAQKQDILATGLMNLGWKEHNTEQYNKDITYEEYEN